MPNIGELIPKVNINVSGTATYFWIICDGKNKEFTVSFLSDNLRAIIGSLLLKIGFDVTDCATVCLETTSLGLM